VFSPYSTATRLAALALVLALAAFLYLCFADTYSGTTSNGVTVEHTSSTLIEENGVGIVGVLVIPVALAAIGLMLSFGRSASRAMGLWVTAVVLLGFCVVAILSVGWLYAPAAITLVVAAAKATNARPREQPA
jgi:hypothetical protein